MSSEGFMKQASILEEVMMRVLSAVDLSLLSSAYYVLAAPVFTGLSIKSVLECPMKANLMLQGIKPVFKGQISWHNEIIEREFPDCEGGKPIRVNIGGEEVFASPDVICGDYVYEVKTISRPISQYLLYRPSYSLRSQLLGLPMHHRMRALT
ncbi:hypothetical protein [Vulcanisaeta sp. JCM 16159]|uniref:hypothetical protein n=1 Tax=Vulcanisaeta sp. JCM 16159 TaxID=1295371 RepID=UPI001FB4CB3E|nr:hypothetical protein [Vulcanisaeta sp. JCM 16159]